jgi:thymidylate synthase (FAD)
MEIKKLLNDGFVRLDASLADDLRVVNSARVSVDVRHEQLEPGDDKLIEFLMKRKHGTPFEHNSMCFHVRAPITLFREWHRHRIGVSINEMSARYVEMKRAFLVPALETIRHQVGRPGHYTFETADPALALKAQEIMMRSCNASFDAYQDLLDLGIAKEQARNVLPVTTYSEMYWTCNARSLMAFLTLRNAPDAMYELRLYAQAMEEIWQTLMPITANAFIQNGRIAP